MRSALLSILLLAVGCSSASPSPDPPAGAPDDTPAAAPPAPAPAPAPPTPAPDPRSVAFTTYVKDELSKYDIPGAQVAVVLDGKLAFTKSLGVKKHGGTDPVTDATRFRVASLSKVVLGATALSLVEEGKLDLSHAVTDYAKTFHMKSPADASTITMEQLLTHTSGVPDMRVSFKTCAGVPTLDAFFTSTDPSQPSWSPPGAVWDYSNRGFAVAGYALEGASGQPYEALATARVLTKGGMSSATFDLATAMAGDHAVGWAPDPTSGTPTSYEPNAYDCVGSRPPAGILATATDYAHFIETLLAGGGSMLSSSSVATLLTGHATTGAVPGQLYSYGLFIEDGYKGLHVVHHNGEWDAGYLTSMWIVPQAKFGVVVFYNGTGAAPDWASRNAIDTYLGVAKIAPPDDSTASSTWGGFAGTYVDPNHFGTITVTFDGSNLTTTIPQLNVTSAPMTQSSGNSFSFPLGTLRESMTFYPDTTGAPRWFVTRSGVGTKE
jgi:CubicO group peptidase (beta-lactamase class C family)